MSFVFRRGVLLDIIRSSAWLYGMRTMPWKPACYTKVGIISEP